MALRTVCSQGAVFAGNLSDGLRQRVCPVTGHDSIGPDLGHGDAAVDGSDGAAAVCHGVLADLSSLAACFVEEPVLNPLIFRGLAHVRRPNHFCAIPRGFNPHP
jgi:hypothetical protein